jgi:hypothetical protein
MELIETVREAFNDAKNNGYEFSDFTNEEIAVDMMDYNSELENEDFLDIIEAVSAIRSEE